MISEDPINIIIILSIGNFGRVSTTLTFITNSTLVLSAAKHYMIKSINTTVI